MLSYNNNKVMQPLRTSVWRRLLVEVCHISFISILLLLSTFHILFVLRIADDMFGLKKVNNVICSGIRKSFGNEKKG